MMKYLLSMLDEKESKSWISGPRAVPFDNWRLIPWTLWALYYM